VGKAVAGFSRIEGSTPSFAKTSAVAKALADRRPTGKLGRPSPWSSPGGRGKSNGLSLVCGWLWGQCSHGFFEIRVFDGVPSVKMRPTASHDCKKKLPFNPDFRKIGL